MEGQPFGNKICEICYDKKLEGKIKRKLRCGHEICNSCYDKINNNKCPFCRQVIKTPSIDIIPKEIRVFSAPEVNTIIRYESPPNVNSVENYCFSLGSSRVGRRIQERSKNENRVEALIDDPLDNDEELMFDIDISE